MAKERVKVSMDYNLKSHIIGKIWMIFALAVFFSVPTTICLYYDVKPDMSVLGTWAVIVPFLINFFSGVFEPIIYSPMLGVNSAYLAFITGNLSNLKIPCVVKAQEICGTKLGTEENEVVSTLSVATSTLVTTVIIAIFVLILAVSGVKDAVLENEWIIPAFTCVVYALFGSLGGKYVVKNIKLAVFPLVIIVAISVILGFAMPKFNVGSAYLFVGIALCALFAVLQIVREKKKQKLQEEKDHLEEIAQGNVEINQDSCTSDTTQSDDVLNDESNIQDGEIEDETSDNEISEKDSETSVQEMQFAEEVAEEIAEDTQSVD